MRALVPVFVLVLPSMGAAQTWSVESPGRNTTVTLARGEDGRLTWSVSRKGSPVLERSPVGIRRDDAAFVDGLTLVAAGKSRRIDERYTTLHGKRREHHVAASEQTLTFSNPGGARLEIDIRAHEDGAAMRYRFPGTGKHTVTEELTGFAVPAGATGWLMPHQEAGRYGPAYEDYFEQVPAGSTSQPPRPAASTGSSSRTLRRGSASAHVCRPRRCRGRRRGGLRSPATRPAASSNRTWSTTSRRPRASGTRAGSVPGERRGAGGRPATARRTRAS